MTKSKSAFLFSSRKLAKDRLFMWTFTFKELLGLSLIHISCGVVIRMWLH